MPINSGVNFQNVFFILEMLGIDFLTSSPCRGLNPIPNRSGHVTYNERADSALTW